MRARKDDAVAVSDDTTSRRLPGVEGVWVFVGADAVVFALLFGSFLSARLADPAVFEASRRSLDANLGGLNTLILLTSSWLVARAVAAIGGDQPVRASRLLAGGVLTGALFVVSKGVEYADKIVAGLTPVTNPFFMWYFVLTGVHLLHVLGGIAALTVVWTMTRRGRFDGGRRAGPECVATFWHLVDLLWIMIFPLLYLLR